MNLVQARQYLQVLQFSDDEQKVRKAESAHSRKARFFPLFV